MSSFVYRFLAGTWLLALAITAAASDRLSADTLTPFIESPIPEYRIVHGMDISPIRDLVALGVPEGKVRLFDIDAQEWLESLVVPDSTQGVQVYTPKFNHDGRLLASTTHDGRAVVWDVESRELKWVSL